MKNTEKLVLDNLKLVDYCLHHQFNIHTLHPDYEDFRQEGYVGLILAAQRYDKTTGFSFSTFALSYIHGYIQKYKNDNSYTSVKIPRRLSYKIGSVAFLLEKNEPVENILKQLDMTKNEYLTCLNVINPYSLNLDLPDENATLQEIIGRNDNGYNNVETDLFIQDILRTTSSYFAKETHKKLWEEYLSLNYQGHKVTASELAEKYNMSRTNAQNIINRGKGYVKKILNTNEA